MVLRHPEQVLARPVDLIRQLQFELCRALLRVEENPEGENHQALAVKGERHLTCGPEAESNPTIAVRGERDSHLLDNNDQRKFTISHSHLFSAMCH